MARRGCRGWDCASGVASKRINAISLSLLSAATVADRLALRGYCPVTFQRGPPGFDSIIPGDPSRFAAAYHGHFYAFASQECLDAFMRQVGAALLLSPLLFACGMLIFLIHARIVSIYFLSLTFLRSHGSTWA